MPVHEVVQAAVGSDDLEPRAQPQVEGVAQTDLLTDVVQRLRGHCLDRPVSADRHEDGGLNDAVGQGQRSAAGGAVGLEEFKLHRIFREAWRRRS